jgi:DNA-binding transcriptional ArsR family regulator
MEVRARPRRGIGRRGDLTFNKQLLIYCSVQREDTVFRALSDPSRRAILERLTRGESAVKDLTARFDISQPAVSQHLATLRHAGLVSERREGRLVYYRIEPKGLRPLVDWIAHYQAFWLDRLPRLEALLKEMG